MVGMRAELNRLLSDLDGMAAAEPRPETLWLFCLGLSYRRHALKPVERLSARVQWAKMAVQAFKRAEVEDGSRLQPSVSGSRTLRRTRGGP